MRLLCAAVLALSAGLLIGQAQEKKDPPKDAPKADAARADKLKEVRKKFDDQLAELKKKFDDAKTPAERNAVVTEARELATLTAEKAVKFAEENPKDEIAFDAAEFVLQQLAGFATGPNVDKAVGVVVDHHLGNPKVKGLIMTAGRFGSAGEKLLKAASEKATDKEVKGLALYHRGTALAEQADDADDPKKADALVTEAIGLLEQAAKEAPDAKLGGDTLAKAAEGEITALKSLKVGAKAPDVEATDLDGKKVKLSSYKGKVVLLDIWATWCGPCVAMIPHSREVVKKLADKPFALISVSADAEKETLVKFMEKEPMPWTHWWDGRGGPVLKAFRVKAFPTLYLIDANGVIRKKWIGSPENEVLDKAIEELVTEALKSKG
jgi:thiol-disulfide isomerase/thioredoxin